MDNPTQVKVQQEPAPIYLQPSQLPSIGQLLKEGDSALPQYESSSLKATQRFIDFIDTLGTIQFWPLRRDVFLDCSQDTAQAAINQMMVRQQVVQVVRERAERVQYKPRHKRVKWREIEFHALIWTISKYADKMDLINVDQEMTLQHWKEIGEFFPAPWDSCLNKWFSLKKAYLCDFNWSEEENQVFSSIVGDRGETLNCSGWQEVAAIHYCTFATQTGRRIFRTPKQCREHWISHIDPKIMKGRWTMPQDIILLTCIIRHDGAKRWSQITKILRGRTQNALKNRFYFIFQRQRKKRLYYYNTDLEILALHIQKLKSKMIKEAKEEELEQIRLKEEEAKKNMEMQQEEESSWESQEQSQDEQPQQRSHFTAKYSRTMVKLEVPKEEQKERTKQPKEQQ